MIITNKKNGVKLTRMKGEFLMEGWVHGQKKQVDDYPTLSTKTVSNFTKSEKSCSLDFIMEINEEIDFLELNISTMLSLKFRGKDVVVNSKANEKFQQFTTEHTLEHSINHASSNITINQTLINNNQSIIYVIINNTVLANYTVFESYDMMNITLTGYEETLMNVSIKKLEFECFPNGKNEYEAAKSCKLIKEKYPTIKSGTYWILYNGNPTIVYCDMETEGGGWLMIGNISLTTKHDVETYKFSSLLQPTLKYSNYGNFLFDSSKMLVLQNQFQFKEIRIYCTKEWHSRVFHAVIHNPRAIDYIVKSNTGEIFQWISCKDGITYLSDDTSSLKDKGTSCIVDVNNDQLLYYHIIYAGLHHVQVYETSRLECDDFVREKTNYERIGKWQYNVR